MIDYVQLEQGDSERYLKTISDVLFGFRLAKEGEFFVEIVEKDGKIRNLNLSRQEFGNLDNLAYFYQTHTRAPGQNPKMTKPYKVEVEGAGITGRKFLRKP